MRTMVTTSDNPYNYFTQFDEWNAFDTQKGYNTLSYFARVARLSPDLTIEQNEQERNRAVDSIVRMNLTGLYVKVYETDTPRGAT